MKKPFLCLVLSLSLLLTSCASTQTGTTPYSGTQISTTEPTQTSAPITVLKNSNYTITELSGEYYLTLNSSVDTSVNNMQSASVIFSSLKDMRDKILNNKLSEHELNIVANFPKDENGIKILDVNNLYIPKVLDKFESSSVTWSGETYSFVMYDGKTSGDMYSTFMCLNDESYEKMYAEFENFAENPLINIIKTEKISDRNATVIYCTTSTSKFKSVSYEIEVNGTKLVIEEDYLLEFSSNPDKTSETVPQRVTIYGKNEVNGTYFKAYVSNLTERPALEWFNSFVLEEYKD